jgi:formylglycine-generating enzyme required for sulfatase activity
MSIWSSSDEASVIVGGYGNTRPRVGKFLRYGSLTLAAAMLCGAIYCNKPDDDPPESSDPVFTMVPIAGGTFTMGAPETEANKREQESPQRQVTLTGFYMSKYQITQGLYKEIMGVNPSYFQGEKLLERLQPDEVVNSDYLPVENIRWYDAIVFCNKLSLRDNLSPAYDIDSVNKDPNNYSTRESDPKWTVKIISGANGYRLPTEAQWEYAARAGTTGRWYTGTPVTIAQANYNGLTEHTSDGGTAGNLNHTTEVGSYPPNPWGLHDMYGNVYEFCWDWIWDYTPSIDPILAVDADGNPTEYANKYANAYELYPNPTDPQGMPRGDRKAERGGTYHHSQTEASSTWRERVRPERALDDLGFRVVKP